MRTRLLTTASMAAVAFLAVLAARPALGQSPAIHVPDDVAPSDPAGGGEFGPAFDVSQSCATLGIHDGVLTGVGDDYKATFDADGILFTPALGDSVPTNQPLRLTLESIHRGKEVVYTAAGNVAPRFADLTVDYPRGAVTERYDLSPKEIEQSFVFDREPGTEGDLVVRLRVATPLTATTGRGLKSLELRAGTAGGVDIGRVLGIAADGSEQVGHLNYLGTHLELVLPHDFVASAAYPLVLDPPISGNSTFAGPNGGGQTLRKPDVAYMRRADTYLVVYEQVYSASDHDIYGQYVSSQGSPVGGRIAIETSGSDEREPAVASMYGAYCFAVVYQRGPQGSRDIICRPVGADAGTVGSPVAVAATSRDEFEPDVGGTIYALGHEALVVWAATGSGVHCAQLRVTSVPFSMVYVRGLQLSGGPNCRRPAISKSGGLARRYLVAWEGGDGDSLWARFVDSDSNALSAAGYVPTGGRNPLWPKVDGDGTNFVVTYSHQEVAGSNDSFDTLFLRAYPPSSSTALWNYGDHRVIDSRPGISSTEPAIASINGRSIVAIAERIGPRGSPDYRLIASSRNSDGTLNGPWYDIGDPYSAFPVNVSQAAASRESGGTADNDALFVWATDDGNGTTRIRGRRYMERVQPGTFTRYSPGCGQLDIRLTGGPPNIGSTFGFELQNFQNPLGAIVFGFRPQSVPLCGNCVLTSTAEITYPIFGSSLSFPLDPGWVGAPYWVQGVELGPPTGGCDFFGVPLTLSPCYQLTIGNT